MTGRSQAAEPGGQDAKVGIWLENGALEAQFYPAQPYLVSSALTPTVRIIAADPAHKPVYL